jgi:hypothetical protein
MLNTLLEKPVIEPVKKTCLNITILYILLLATVLTPIVIIILNLPTRAIESINYIPNDCNIFRTGSNFNWIPGDHDDYYGIQSRYELSKKCEFTHNQTSVNAEIVYSDNNFVIYCVLNQIFTSNMDDSDNQDVIELVVKIPMDWVDEIKSQVTAKLDDDLCFIYYDNTELRQDISDIRYNISEITEECHDLIANSGPFQCEVMSKFDILSVFAKIFSVVGSLWGIKSLIFMWTSRSNNLITGDQDLQSII